MLTVNYHRIERHDERFPDLFRLRYQVYCNQCGFEDPANYPDMIEQDEYDDYAVHFGKTIAGDYAMDGTVRMILYSEMGFPIEKNFIIDPLSLPAFDRSRIAEISRLAISKDFRRKKGDGILYTQKKVDFTDKNSLYKKKSRQKNINYALGLYQCIYQESLKRGLTHWYAAMTDGLYYLLTGIGCVWHPIGPKMNYHGWRRPYIAVIAENAEAASRNFRR